MTDEAVTVHEVVERGWTPPHQPERILSLTQARDTVIIITDSRIYEAKRNYDGFICFLIGHLS